MCCLQIRLFGRFSVQYEDQALSGFDARKVQELLSYLVIFRNRPHPREALASLLWSDSSTAQSRKYLRQALWQLQATLDAGTPAGRGRRMLAVDAGSVQARPDADVWLDVAEFEGTFARVREIPGARLDLSAAEALQAGVALYQGDLLEGWYQDWCLYERERLQNMYLGMLEKLVAYCAARRDYDAGLLYAERVLRHDRARESTHRRLMQLHLAAGDRTAALRQFERCVAALREELGVAPSARTIALYQQIRAGTGEAVSPWDEPQPPPMAPPAPLVADVLGHLRRLQQALGDLQNEVLHDIRAIERAIHTRR